MGDSTSIKPCFKSLVLLPFLFSTFISRPQTLTIYSIPAPRSYHWNSPGKLVFSYLSNFITRTPRGSKRHLIGHMMVELKDSTRHVIAGVSAGKKARMTRKVVFQGHGLGILFEKINGVMEETAVNLPDIQQRSATGEIAFLQFRVNQPVFDRLWKYYTEYKERGYHHFYNGLNNPLKGEGAGCSAFAFSFLEVAGLSDMVPPEICRIERPVQPDLVMNNRYDHGPVSLIRLLFSGKWASIQDTNALLYRTYEPTWLYRWIKAYQPEMPVSGLVQKTQQMKAPGILIDCSNRPVPEGPIWKTAIVEKQN